MWLVICLSCVWRACLCSCGLFLILPSRSSVDYDLVKDGLVVFVETVYEVEKVVVVLGQVVPCQLDCLQMKNLSFAIVYLAFT